MKSNTMQNNEYKKTHLGCLPKEWKIEPIANLGEVITGRTPSTKKQKYYGGQFKLISPANLGESMYVNSAHRWLTEEGLEASRVLPKDTVLVSCIGYIGKTGLTTDKKSATNQQINAIICSPNINPRFVYFLLTYWQSYIETYARVTTVPILNKTNFKAIEVPLPPLPEQSAIAHVLSTVRKTIEATERVITAAHELKRSMMKHLFTYGPVPVDQADQVSLKDTEIGEIPEVWSITKIEEVCRINAVSRDPSTELPDEYFVYIDISSIESETGRIVSPSLMLGKNAPSRARRVVHKDDVILSTVRPYLKAFAIIPQDYDNQICSTGFAVLTNKEVVTPKYIYYICLSDIVGQQFTKRMKGASYPAINIGDVKKTKIPTLSIGEQSEIGGILSTIDDKIFIESQRISALESLFNSLLHHLMTGQIRVKY